MGDTCGPRADADPVIPDDIKHEYLDDNARILVNAHVPFDAWDCVTEVLRDPRSWL